MNDTLTTIEEEVITINQGRSRSPYFCIIQPVPGIKLKIGQPLRCKNPKTNQVTTGIVTEHFWTFDWDEMPVWVEVKLLECYGVAPQLLRMVLKASDSGFNDNWARLILIKETI